MSGRRIGLELELLTPEDKDRDDVAAAFCDVLRKRGNGGGVVYGFKHRVDGELAPGVPRCVLSCASRVVSDAGVDVASFVDDPTIRVAAPAGARPVLYADDTRLSTLLADLSWSSSPEIEQRTGDFLSTTRSTWESGRVINARGEVMAVRGAEPRSHHRACEIVSAVLDDEDAVASFVDAALEAAEVVGCVVPDTAALHVHLDAAPYRDAKRLARLLIGWNARRDQHLDRLRTNRRCLKLGPFPDDAVRAAAAVLGDDSDVEFSVFAAALSLAGVKKELDLNVKGVIEKHPAQPTLEVRCLPMSLSTTAIRRSIDDAIALVDALADG